MTLESLIASASINIGLALVALWLFSVLKKQPRNAVVYYARRLSDRHHHRPLSLCLPRFLPSVAWIPRAFRVPEEDILSRHSLDALVLIRLFKLGIRFFLLCSLLGVSLLLPVDYYNESNLPTRRENSMDAFTISNITRGSNKLWVHFSCLWFISFYALFLLHTEILVIRLHQMRELRHRADQFTVLVRQVPLCPEHKTRGCAVDHFFSKHHRFSYHSYQMLYDGKDLEYLLRKQKKLKKELEDRRHTYRKALISDGSQEHKQISTSEEKLQELTHMICHLQSETMLREKVFFLRS